MEKLITKEISIDKKIVKGKLPKKMILYLKDSDNLILTVKRDSELEEESLMSIEVNVKEMEDKYSIAIPKKITEFYHLDEYEYTIMISEKKPTLIISI